MEIGEQRPVVLDDLYGILAKAVRVVVTVEPTEYATKLFESVDRNDLEDLQRSMLLNTPSAYSHCLCIGSPALYLHESDGFLLALTNHHGTSIRCSLWDSDVPIRDTERWLSWFDRRGMPGPRQEVEAMRAQEERETKDWNSWLAAMPVAIKQVWSSALMDRIGRVKLAPLRAALEREMPNQQERILALIEWCGCWAGSWNRAPTYQAAAEELLLEYPTRSIVDAVESSRISPEQTEGAVRLFCGYLFEQHRPGGVKEIPDTLKRVLWNHVKDTQDTDKLSRAAKAFAQ